MSWNPIDVVPDRHSLWSIKLGDLVDSGFEPFGDDRWQSLEWFDDDTRKRFETKFSARYWNAEIGITPPLVWRQYLVSRMAETARKYRPWYALLAETGQPLSAEDEWYKGRDVYSDFPATQLNPGLEDYASNATDHQTERIRMGDMLDTLDRLWKVGDVDSLMVDACDSLFSWTASVAMPW